MTILFTYEAGSRLTGTNVETSDHDYIKVIAEDPEFVTGLGTFEPPQAKEDDSDVSTYGLRKFAGLCAAGNPNLLQGLFVPQKMLVLDTQSGRWLREHSALFVSKRAAAKFKGYALAQFDSLTGARNKKVNRPELVEKYGYDTKFAGHAYRLTVQGAEFLRTGRLELPMEQKHRDVILAIRKGWYGYDSVVEVIKRAIFDLEQAIQTTRLPDEPDYLGINNLLHEIYLDAWYPDRG